MKMSMKLTLNGHQKGYLNRDVLSVHRPSTHWELPHSLELGGFSPPKVFRQRLEYNSFESEP